MTTAAPTRRTTLKTELGLKITVSKSHKLAETVATEREQLEVIKDRYQRRLEGLLVQMQEDKITTVKARTAAGFTYEFAIENKGEAVKVRRVVEKNTEKAQDN